MTNSRLTDPEILEFRFPVRLTVMPCEKVRVGTVSGRGGMGGVRRIRFLEPMTASILSNGRIHPHLVWQAVSRVCRELTK
jgi:5-oxoprolinase (ATP-hydrolysing)